tara:strand:- start:54 stop:413 length:360 start_codon:yes stop_codon:yes gene_type:complete
MYQKADNTYGDISGKNGFLSKVYRLIKNRTEIEFNEPLAEAMHLCQARQRLAVALCCSRVGGDILETIGTYLRCPIMPSDEIIRRDFLENKGPDYALKRDAGLLGAYSEQMFREEITYS